jgi:hypothetical protein
VSTASLVTSVSLSVQLDRSDRVYPWPHHVVLTPERPECPPGPYVGLPFDADDARWFALHGDCSDLALGTIFAAVLDYSLPEASSDDPVTLLAQLSVAESPTCHGGALVRSGANFAVIPGCCCGPESWNDFIFPLELAWSPYCGHAPDYRFDVTDRHVLVRADDELRATLDRESLAAAITTATEHTRAFSARMRPWLERWSTPEIAHNLASRLDAYWALLGRREVP